VKITVYSCHEGAQENLLREWVSAGHEIFLVDGCYAWNQDRVQVPRGVTCGNPAGADLVSVGITQDIPRALFHRTRTLRIHTPIVMTHHWYPSEKRLSGWLYHRVHHICICQHERKILLERWGADAEVCYPPVDTVAFSPRQAAVDLHKVMVVGNRIVSRPIMGWDKLQEIILKTHRLAPDVQFEILGENPEIEEEAFPNVTTRNLPHLSLPDHESTARCLIWPTTTSLVPSSMLSAMALGKTVMCFDLPPHREVIDDARNGYLIPCYDTDLYARRIADLAGTPEDGELGKRARETVLAVADVAKVASQYEDLFKRLTGR